MHITRRKLKKLIVEELDLILEQEDTVGDEEEEGGADEPAEDDAAEGEGEGEGDDETEEEEEEISPEEEKVLIKTADDQIQHMLVDFEAKAIKSAQLQKHDDPHTQLERYQRHTLTHLLFEQEVPLDEVPSSEIDLQHFASDVARLIMNYDSLLDMEALIIDKAKAFLEDKYDVATADEFEGILGDQFQISLEEYTDEEETQAPLAVGAFGGEGV
jgi:hypothetical protein